MGRVISTALQFIDGFTKPSKAAIESMRMMGREAIKAGKQIQSAGKVITSAGTTLTAAVTAPTMGIATVAVKTAADFEAAMSQVAATMGKSKTEIEELTKLAQQMGRDTAFSASEAAEGINILAMAGLDAKDINASLGTVLDLAAAGAMDMGSSATYVVGAVKGFRDEMGNASKYADLMAKGASLANTDVKSLGEAISYGAATADGYSQSVDSMTLSLLRMAEQNVTGQTAATSLNRAMADLYSPTEGAKKALDSLGISAYTANGSARDFNVVVDELALALKGMSEAEANTLKSTIFTTNGMNAFNKMTASTSQRVEELQKGLSEAGGSAAQQAFTQLDNLRGQLTLLKSAAEGIAITVGNKLLPHVKTGVSWTQKAADCINNLSDAQVENIMKWAGIAAAVGPAVLIIGNVVTTVGKAVTAFGTVTKTISKFGGIAGMITSPAGIVIGVLAAIAVAAFLIIKNWDKVKGFLFNVGSWFKEVFQKAGISVEDFSATFFSIGKTVGSVAGTIWKVIKSVAAVFIKEFGPDIATVAREVGEILKTKSAVMIKAVVEIAKAVDFGIKIFDMLLKFFCGAFIGNWDSAAKGFRDSIKNIFPANVADGLISAFDKTLPIIIGIVEGIKAVFGDAVKDIKEIFGILKGVFKGIGIFLKGVVTGDAETAFKGLEMAAKSVVDGIGNIFRSKLTQIKTQIKNILSNFLPQESMKKIEGAFDAAASIWNIVINSMKYCINNLASVVKVVFSVIESVSSQKINSISAVVEGIKTVFNGITTFVSGVFTGNWTQAWEGVKTIFTGIFDSLAALCKAPMNAVIAIINGAISGINKLGLVIPDWVPGLGGKTFAINVPPIPMLYKGTNNWQGGAAVIHDRGGEIVDLPKGSRVYPHDKSIEIARREGAAQGRSVVITIKKLADKIEVRNDQDIDRIAEAMVVKLKKVALNTGKT